MITALEHFVEIHLSHAARCAICVVIMLNINHAERDPDFPDLPTLTELGYPNADVPIWNSMHAPAGTPVEIIAKLNARIVEIAKTDEMRARLRSINAAVVAQSPTQVAAYMAENMQRNAELIKAANIKLE